MRSEVLKYLKKQTSHLPRDIDRLIVSAFLTTNKIKVKNNNFIKEYIITANSPKKELKALSELVSIIDFFEIQFDFEALIRLFEFVVSPSDKIINGAVYTPDFIRKYIVDRSLLMISKDINSIKAADISCGCGGFLLTLTQNIRRQTGKRLKKIYSENIYGIDIAEYSITRSKILLALFAIVNNEDEKEFSFNLYCENALTFSFKEKCSEIKKNEGFDLIVGNPPYVCSRNMDLKTLEIVKELKVGKTGHPDLYIPFFQIGIEQLNNSGILGYITVNTFMKSVNGRALREYFSEKRIRLTILNFGGEQIFSDRNTYTCICFIQNSEGEIRYIRTESKKLDSIDLKRLHKFDYSILNDKDGWNLVNDKTVHTFIRNVESTGIPFKELYNTKNGIATLKNDVYKFKPIKEDRKYYYLIDDNTLFKIEKDICRDIVNANKIKVPSDIDLLREKIIFPYDGNSQIFPKQLLKTKFPQAYTYLLTKKNILSKRDKGTKSYEEWYAYGRRQSMDIHAYKLFFPHICDRPSFVLCEEKDLLFYNGIALISDDLEELHFIKKILESELFFKYIKNTTKDYSSGYISMSRNYLKNFGVCQLTDDQRNFLLNTNDYNDFLYEIYGIEVNYPIY